MPIRAISEPPIAAKAVVSEFVFELLVPKAASNSVDFNFSMQS